MDIQAIRNGTIDLPSIERSSNDEVRALLNKLKGIGNWTIDVYLMFVLQRIDIFPIGDLAAVNALKQLKKLPGDIPRNAVLDMAENWQPNRTVATMLLWHYYLSLRVKNKT